MLFETFILTIGAVLFNGLGLAEKITFHTKYNLIINCSKCLTFWIVFINLLYDKVSFFNCFTIALTCSYLALWLELLLSLLNKIYNGINDKIYTTEKILPSTSSTDPN